MSSNSPTEEQINVNTSSPTEPRHVTKYEPEYLKRYETVASYIPTYIAAVKTNSNVTLDDVSRPQPCPTETAFSLTNGSTGPMTDTASSWVDDDDVFVQYVTKSAEEKAWQKQKENLSATLEGPSEESPSHGRGGPESNGGGRRRRGGKQSAGSGWQMVENANSKANAGGKNKKRPQGGFADAAPANWNSSRNAPHTPNRNGGGANHFFGKSGASGGASASAPKGNGFFSRVSGA